MLSNAATQTKSYYNLSILQKPSFSTLDTPIQTFSGLKRSIMFSGLFLCSVKSWLGFFVGFSTKKAPKLCFRKICITIFWADLSCY